MTLLADDAGLLAGVVVLEIGRGTAAAYAGKLLAELGAAVTHAVLPGEEDGARCTPAFTAFMREQKRSVEVKSGTAGHDDLLALARLADVVLDDRPPARAAPFSDLVARDNAKTVCVHVTPFGMTGPYRDFRAGDLELSFLSGLAHLTPRDVPRPADALTAPPMKMPGSLVSLYCGASAAAAAMTGLVSRGLHGSALRFDVSMLEALIPTIRREIALFHYEQRVASRFMRVWRLAPYGVKSCADGYVFLQVVEKYHWEALVAMLGAPEWALDPRYLDAEYRFEHRERIEAALAPWLLVQRKQEFARDAQRRGLPFAAINSLDELPAIEQLKHRGYFRSIGGGSGSHRVPGCTYILSSSAARAELPVRPRGHARAGLPLSGLRVIDFGHVWAGPYCTALLADMGAEVIKIESEQRPDVHRRQGPFSDRLPGVNRSGVWNSQNRGKRSVALNLSTGRGQELARQLVAEADVVVENFAPGVMAKLGLDYTALSSANPGLVMLSLSAFGQHGPQSRFIGYGPSLDAWSGLNWMTGYEGGPPQALGGVFPDTGSALHGAVALLAALHARAVSGRGRYIDLSELEVSIALLSDAVVEALRDEPVSRAGNSSALVYPHDCYPARGVDAWVALSVPDEPAWHGLCALLNRPQWAADVELASPAGRRRAASSIEAAIAAWVKCRDPEEAMLQLQQAGVAAGHAHTAQSLLEDRHLAAREFFKVVDHPEAGPAPLYGAIWRTEAGAPALRPAPCLGEGTADVLGAVLGLGRDEVAALAAERIAR